MLKRKRKLSSIFLLEIYADSSLTVLPNFKMNTIYKFTDENIVVERIFNNDQDTLLPCPLHISGIGRICRYWLDDHKAGDSNALECVLKGFIKDTSRNMRVVRVWKEPSEEVMDAGGFVFKQWKEKFFFLSMKGSLAICRDPDALPEAEISLHSSCKAIVKGSQISDLPRLPLGAQTDCCLALILTEGKLLLLLAANTEDCSHWLKVLRKMKESFSPNLSLCRIHIGKEHSTSDREKQHVAVEMACHCREAKLNRSKGRQPRGCLRHGSQSSKVVRAACLLVGGAATGPNLGYMMTSSSAPASESVPLDFKELGIHSSDCCQDTDCSAYSSFECETMDQDFDTFDFGGFAF
ncbi:uncharacterized protein si:ch1073-83n3.2 [Stegostoma tigrinum]|uniref:uncharacterized protein si:ch1073-83n3.2 n=1 Tax=Stegostoma tigrinum TaxID=3053191 RepID=UPI00286FD340|nr:uncharacterized protein si:ch1073-83n3.2 [Stegostoma tigrinum]